MVLAPIKNDFQEDFHWFYVEARILRIHLRFLRDLAILTLTRRSRENRRRGRKSSGPQDLNELLTQITKEAVSSALAEFGVVPAPQEHVRKYIVKIKGRGRAPAPIGVETRAPMPVQDMVDQSPIRRADPLIEKLQQRAVEQVLNGTTWLTSKEVSDQVDPEAKNKHALAHRLLGQRRVFAINRRNQKEFPRYQFDPLGQPIDSVARVLEIFQGYTPFRIASWFESTSSELGGRRPREVLADNPAAVIEAAAAHVHGATHG